MMIKQIERLLQDAQSTHDDIMKNCKHAGTRDYYSEGLIQGYKNVLELFNDV